MTLEKWDDHYNQSRYKYEGKQSHFQTIREGQRWNYPFLFNRQARPVFVMAWEKSHRSKWFKEKNYGR